jgi:hypothetical protein
MSKEQKGDKFLKELMWPTHTKLFYERNPRSKQLREICIGVTAALGRLFYDPTATNKVERERLLAELKAEGEQLSELGIKPDMHLEKTWETFHRNSVVMAESIAGELLSTCRLVLGQEPLPINPESGEETPLEQFLVDAVGTATSELDCEEEVKRIAKRDFLIGMAAKILRNKIIRKR